MDRLKEFWLAGACHIKRKKSNNNKGLGNGVSSATLGILNFTSAFIFLLAGTGLAAIVFAFEFFFFWFGRKKLSSWSNKDCCNLISLSMGMTLSFRDSVREAMEAHKKAQARQCKSPLCDTKLWKANYELRQARTEIGKLQSELERLNVPDKAIASGPCDPTEYNGDISLDDLKTDRNSIQSIDQSYHPDYDEDDIIKDESASQSHLAQVHLNNGDVANSASQSNRQPCPMGDRDDDDDDDEASVRVTLL